MASAYNGVCIGGVAAGVRYVHQGRIMVLKETPAPRLSADPAPPGTPEITHHVYNFHHTGRVGLWIPEGQSIDDALETMLEAYMGVQHGR